MTGGFGADPEQQNEPVAAAKAGRGDDYAEMVSGRVSTPESLAAELQLRLDALHRQKEDLNQTIRNIEWERARHLRNQAPKPRKPLEVHKAPSAPAPAEPAEPAEPTLEQLWNQEK